jgi:hypothetical protein
MNTMLTALATHRGFVSYRLAKLPTGKADKIPFNGITGFNSDAQDPATWMIPEMAEAFAREWAPVYKDGTGVGIVIYQGSQLFCIDLDGCIDEAGNWSDIARSVVARFPGAVIEVSQSGKGLHIFGMYRGVLPPHAKKNSAWHLELYTEKRFIALTGNFAQGYEAGHIGTDCTEALTTFAAEYFPAKGGAYSGEWTDGPAEGWDFITDDDELLAWAGTYRDSKTVFGSKAPIPLLMAADESLGEWFPANKPGETFDPSSADQAMANFFAWATGNNCERTERLMRRTQLARPKWDSRDDYLPGTIAKACAESKKWPTLTDKSKQIPDEPTVTDDDPRPVILLSSGRFDRYAAQAELLLVDTLYVRGESLVRIGTASDISKAQTVVDPKTGAELWEDGTGTKRDAAQAVCIPASSGWLRRALMARAQFWKFDKRANAWEERDCPKELSENISDQKSWATFRPLIAIAPAPFLRPDMTVCEAPGYDVATGIYYQPTIAFPAIIPQPTRDDALQALARLREPFAEFPFASPEAEAGFIAHILTSILRPGIATVPVWFYAASLAASGKTLLASMPSLIAYGAPAPQSPYTEKDELRKVLFSSLLAGDAALTLDNVPKGIGVDSDVLCHFATSDTYSARVLGASVLKQLPNRCTVTLTGNNITPMNDMARRSIVVRLEVNAESARGRKFRIDNLQAHVRQRRGQFIVDAITVVRAYAFAGFPTVAHPLESFEGWSRIVRDPLVWLGMADPVKAQATETDDDVEPLRAAFDAMATLTASNSHQFTASQLAPMIAISPDARPKLLDAGCTEPADPAKLGYWLRSHKGRVAGSWQLKAPAMAGGGVNRWLLRQVG